MSDTLLTTCTANARCATTLVIACGAIAHELLAVIKANGWQHLDIQCLPAEWHNSPHKITPAVEAKIVAHKHAYKQLFVAYADCGTGGRLDALLDKHGIQRLPGDHCYHFFAGRQVFEDMAEAEPGTFYLTDYLAEHFERLILDGLGITRYPELRDTYFSNYTRLVYLQQDTLHRKAAMRIAQAEAAARALNLPLQLYTTGLTPFSDSLKPLRIPVVPESVNSHA